MKSKDKMDEKVSIIIRTCGRPHVLKNALNSVREQTYKNIEVIVVEDGEETAKEMIESDYKDCDIHYFATKEKKGRAVAGNLALGIASGAYFNFLDDDDILYPSHVEILLREINEQKVLAAYSIADESQIRIISEKPYCFKEKRIIQRYKQPYNRLLLYSFNYIPIQSILFSRTFYDELGGFDEKLEYLEDWDVWVRYSTMGDFWYVPCITSKYYVPYRSKKKMQRNRELDMALGQVREKFNEYKMKISVGDISQNMDYVLNVYNKKGVLYYVKMIRNFILYGEL